MAKGGKKATAADAEICMKLYDLRRESEMRKARSWFVSWQPQSFEDFQKISFAFGSQENAWFRQVLTYWENAASLPLSGAVNADLFLQWNGEMLFSYVKVKPYIAQIRQHMKSPEFMQNIETFFNSTPALKKRVTVMEERFKMFAEMRAKAAKA